MRLLRFLTESPEGLVPRLGALDPSGERVVDLAAAYTRWLQSVGADLQAAKQIAVHLFAENMRDFIALGPWGLEQARAAVEFAAGSPDPPVSYPLDRVRLLAPVQPRVLRDCLAFEEHTKNAYARLNLPVPPVWYEMPVYYKGNPLMVVGPDEDVRWPSYSEVMDYELEIAIVIGPGGRDIPAAEAHRHIYGVTILNDFSARDVQAKEMAVGLGPAKGKDFAYGLGPWIVTIDEIPELYNLEMVARVNGEVWSRGNTGTIYWKFDRIIAHISAAEILAPGDVIGSGTVGGGCGLELGRFLRPGDLVELEVSGIGTLRNRVIR